MSEDYATNCHNVYFISKEAFIRELEKTTDEMENVVKKFELVEGSINGTSFYVISTLTVEGGVDTLEDVDIDIFKKFLDGFDETEFILISEVW